MKQHSEEPLGWCACRPRFVEETNGVACSYLKQSVCRVLGHRGRMLVSFGLAEMSARKLQNLILAGRMRDSFM